MKIPFIDLNLTHKEIEGQINQAIRRVIKRGDFILSRELELFEKEFARFCGVRYAIGVSSGTEALFLALLSLGIGRGDEVIIPDFTFIATALAVCYTGAKVVFVDIDERTYNIDINKIEKAITRYTKVIIPVHLYGQPAQMPQILKIARAYNLKVIEDAAQAHGARIKMPDGRWCMVGAIGDIGCFSFYPSKNLGALGDGGMVVTNNEVIYRKILSLRDYGRVSKYEHNILGFNARLDTLQAAILRVKLRKLNKWNRMRQRIADIYSDYLRNIEDIITPFLAPGVEHVYHIYAIRTRRRDDLVKALKKKGITTIIHYPIPLHLQKVFKYLNYKIGDFGISERVASEVLSLPMHPHLKINQIKFITDSIKRFTKSESYTK
ncbi:MAG: DegT/DnrJ/EryC1/StrS family aminotransferase [Candidatus Omnitrophica bacterium]|nr:DegT/DnrJ/EryC1/StrS family aminotransferase [Candidatus Omnitrophota bacterium]